MKGWVFTFGVDGFGADVAPMHELGCYLNFKNAFNKLVNLNKNCTKEHFFYEEGYGEDCYPENDFDLKEAEKNENWDLFTKLLEKHELKNVEEICKKYCVNKEPLLGMYAIEEIEIF